MDFISDFDGISTCRLALERANLHINKYYSTEIEPYSIKVSQSHFPDNIRQGNIQTGKVWKGMADGMFAGSPCTGFSFAGKQLNFEDPQSKLFFDFVRRLEIVQPKYFMLENTLMKQKYQDIITSYLGVKPVLIDSSICSAQSRKRLYFANFPITQPEFRDIKLKDILMDVPRELVKFSPKVQERFDKFKEILEDPSVWGVNYSSSGRGDGIVEDRITINPDKAYTLTKTGYTSRSITMIKTNKGFSHLTAVEMTRLQGLPDLYLSCIPDKQAKKCLGNGWQLDTVTHIFKCLKETVNAC